VLPIPSKGRAPWRNMSWETCSPLAGGCSASRARLPGGEPTDLPFAVEPRGERYGPRAGRYEQPARVLQLAVGALLRLVLATDTPSPGFCAHSRRAGAT
jgi:hypothetical protein